MNGDRSLMRLLRRVELLDRSFARGKRACVCGKYSLQSAAV